MKTCLLDRCVKKKKKTVGSRCYTEQYTSSVLNERVNQVFGCIVPTFNSVLRWFLLTSTYVEGTVRVSLRLVLHP